MACLPRLSERKSQGGQALAKMLVLGSSPVRCDGRARPRLLEILAILARWSLWSISPTPISKLQHLPDRLWRWSKTRQMRQNVRPNFGIAIYNILEPQLPQLG